MTCPGSTEYVFGIAGERSFNLPWVANHQTGFTSISGLEMALCIDIDRDHECIQINVYANLPFCPPSHIAQVSPDRREIGFFVASTVFSELTLLWYMVGGQGDGPKRPGWPIRGIVKTFIALMIVPCPAEYVQRKHFACLDPFEFRWHAFLNGTFDVV
jgi:hypothetical protein